MNSFSAWLSSSRTVEADPECFACTNSRSRSSPKQASVEQPHTASGTGRPVFVPYGMIYSASRMSQASRRGVQAAQQTSSSFSGGGGGFSGGGGGGFSGGGGRGGR